MPAAFKIYPDSMLKTVRSIQKAMKSKDYAAESDDRKREFYASLFASRAAANAIRGKKSSLKSAAKTEDWAASRDQLYHSETFKRFVAEQGHDEMYALLTAGHGGAAEEKYQQYVRQTAKLPTDVPDRYMPTAKERIDYLKTKAADLSADSDEAVELCAEILRAHQAVGAEKDALDQKINRQKLAQTEDLSQNEVFRSFVKGNPDLRAVLADGTGSKLEEQFRKHILEMDHIPENAPASCLPTAYDRTETLKEKIKRSDDPEKTNQYLIEMMAARECVNAQRKTPETLKKPLPAAAYQQACKTWSESKTFQKFLSENQDEAAAAARTGHGGLMQDKFRLFVCEQEHIGADVPKAYLPTGYDHLESVRKQYEQADYYDSSAERKLTLAAEIMATRESVDAVRKKPDSLKKTMDPKKFQDAYTKWTSCAAFRKWVQCDDPKVQIAVRDAAHAGHGGALGEAFQKHLLTQDQLDNDIPAQFMPTAFERTEALKQKIAEEADAEPERKRLLYAELMATRGAAEAVRKKPDSLKKPLDPEKLKTERDKLLNSETFRNFMEDEAMQDKIRSAGTAGHGGELEDLYKTYVKELDHIPEAVPARYLPTAYDRTEALQKKIKDPEFSAQGDEDRRFQIFAELMATRESVNAERGKPDTLKKPLDAGALQEKLTKWSACTTLRQYVEDYPEEAEAAAGAGHGGALGDKFREYVKKQPEIGTDVPKQMLPDCYERIEAVRQELKNDPDMDLDDQKVFFAQILGTRTVAEAVRKTPDTLKKPYKPEEVNKAADELLNCQAFQDYVDENPEEVRKLALTGHGGELEEKFKQYAAGLSKLPENLPPRYAPTAAERIEALQKKIKSNKGAEDEAEELIGACAELLAARSAVGAKRKTPDSLKVKVPAKQAREAADRLQDCEAFREFVKKEPKAVKDAAASGHGGALEDKFKEYVLNLDKIPEDTPKEYMPNALQRTEVLQKKIRSGAFKEKSLVEQDALYKELMATRASVNSVRGEKQTLDKPIDPEKLGQTRQKLSRSRGVSEFFEADRGAIKDAATSGHGGALEDKLKQDVIRQTLQTGALPEHLPARYAPSHSALKKALTEDIAAKSKNAPRWYETEQGKQACMRKVACRMFLQKQEIEAKKAGKPVPALDRELMQNTVDSLMRSNAFKKMFENEGDTKRIMETCAKGRMSDVFTKFSDNQGRFFQPQPQPQPEANLHREQQRENQAGQNENQPAQEPVLQA